MSFARAGTAGTSSERPRVGDELVLDVGPVAHGGHVVARAGALVVFVRHALPGERVRVRITQVRSRYLRADAVDVISAHPQRREPSCPVAGECGGCDFQHATETLQRSLKTHVLREALVRHGRIPQETVEALTAEGVIDLGAWFGWRTRMRYRVAEHSERDASAPSEAGRTLALRRHRSDDLVDVRGCTIAEPRGHAEALRIAQRMAPGEDLWMAMDHDVPVVSDEVSGHTVQHSVEVDGIALSFTTTVDGFWQVHPALAQALVDTLVEWAAPEPGQTWWDLYAGVGPLAAALGVRVGSTGRVHAVESASEAVALGRSALEPWPWVRLHRADVRTWLRRPPGPRPHGVVLDPPRSGAGATTIEAITRADPERVLIVACDPVALGRDCALLSVAGYEVSRVRAWDAFPQTHHLETLALFERRDRIS